MEKKATKAIAMAKIAVGGMIVGDGFITGDQVVVEQDVDNNITKAKFVNPPKGFEQTFTYKNTSGHIVMTYA